ncbi:MAG: choice-of-anchor tandem repeat GloVer-containing protein [Terriglobales bacterium]|jgi:uncharacterized repeat protein (TIGR03803 family)
MSFTKFTLAALLIFAGLAAIPSSLAQTYTVLYSFTGGTDGALPEGGVVLDSHGNLYGTSTGATQGGLEGSVFKLNPKGKFTLLHSFGTGGADGAEPFNLVRDSAGNLYGTTLYGGSSSAGTVFKLDTKKNFSVLYNFNSEFPGDSYGPSGPLLLDSAGNLYGAWGGGSGKCQAGPDNTCGVVFKLDPSGSETVLHAFSRPKYGEYPEEGLVMDAAGNLYGTTTGGGHGGAGTVFKLDPAGDETVLHTFTGKPDGSEPWAGLIKDSAGNLYGTTIFGGQGNCQERPCGVVFKVDTNGNETVLYRFTGGADGGLPAAGLVMDSAGNLYGTTTYIFGNVFKLDPAGDLTVLHTFTGGTDGNNPVGAGLTLDSAGNLYGTTITGGNLADCDGDGCGVVFKITP